MLVGAVIVIGLSQKAAPTDRKEKTMRLIDADELWKEFCESEAIEERYGSGVLEITGNIIDKAPTIDAVPVIRCKDCVWWTKQEASCQGRCALFGIYPTGAWYCANGAKMDEGGSDGTDD